MSIILGVYAYGAPGVLLGPMLFGALFALKAFYQQTIQDAYLETKRRKRR